MFKSRFTVSLRLTALGGGKAAILLIGQRHFFGELAGLAPGFALAGGGFAVTVSGLAVESDFTKATNCKSCSSFTWP